MHASYIGVIRGSLLRACACSGARGLSREREAHVTRKKEGGGGTNGRTFLAWFLALASRFVVLAGDDSYKWLDGWPRPENRQFSLIHQKGVTDNADNENSRPPPRLPPRGCVDVRNLRPGLPRAGLAPAAADRCSRIGAVAAGSTGRPRSRASSFANSAPVVTSRAWGALDLGCSLLPLTDRA